MREIKFRGKTLDSNEWVYGGYARVDNDYYIYEITTELTEPEMGFYENNLIQTIVDSKTIGQYTGLKDKNGKEIYEGDILKHINPSTFHNKNQLLKIEWENGGCLNRAGFKFERLHEGLTTRFEPETDLEIIGNIYENPELLK